MNVMVNYNGVRTDQNYNDVIDVWLIFGQSNADGRALIPDLPGSLAGPRLGQYIYYKPSVNADADGEWSTLLAGTNNYNPSEATPVFGLEMSFAQEMFEYGQKDFFFIKYGQGSTCMANNGGTFNPNVASSSDCWIPSGNELTVRALDFYVTPALQALRARSINYVVRGAIWFQGECDSGSAPNAAAYQASMLTLMTAVQNHSLINNPDLIWLDFQCQTANLVNMATINTAKQNIQAMFPTRYKYMPNTGYTYADGVHLTAASYVQAGIDAATQAQLLM
jgi:hypothetical protein